MTPYEFPQHDPGDEDARQRVYEVGWGWSYTCVGMDVKRRMETPDDDTVLGKDYTLQHRRRINRNFNSRTNSWRG